MKDSRLYLLVTLALSLVNAVAFPMWVGYAGGNAPFPPGVEAILPYIFIAILNACVLLLVKARSADGITQSRYLFLLALFTRIAYLATRNLLGQNEVDIDIGVFFNYGREFVQGHYPSMEYPQGALTLFSATYLLAAGDLEQFRVVFPLITLPFDLIILGSLLWLGRRYSSKRIASALGLFYAMSPFTLVLWFGKYDSVPTALLALGMLLFAAGRNSFSALALAIGFLTKWFPGIPLAVFAVYLLRAKDFRGALKYTTIATVVIALPILASWLMAPKNTLHTYIFHSLRPLLGQSMLYLPVYLFEPSARLASTEPPWSDVNSNLLSNGLATVVLLVSTGLPLIALTLRQVQKETAVAVAGLSVAMFILMNRVYSPQYILILIAVYSTSILVFAHKSRIASVADLVLLLLTFLNYLIWPLWVESWLAISLGFFALNLAVIIWLFYQTVRADASRKITFNPR